MYGRAIVFLVKNASVKRPIPARATQFIATMIILGIIAIPIGSICSYAEKDPVIVINEDSIQIKALYGVSIALPEISDISILGNSMSEIGTYNRMGGYGSTGVLRGHFKSSSLEDVLLYVDQRSSPTIVIQRKDDSDVYISFHSAEKTNLTYQEIAKHFEYDSR